MQHYKNDFYIYKHYPWKIQVPSFYKSCVAHKRHRRYNWANCIHQFWNWWSLFVISLWERTINPEISGQSHLTLRWPILFLSNSQSGSCISRARRHLLLHAEMKARGCLMEKAPGCGSNWTQWLQRQQEQIASINTLSDTDKLMTLWVPKKPGGWALQPIW